MILEKKNADREAFCGKIVYYFRFINSFFLNMQYQYSRQELLDDFKDWQEKLRKYQIPNTRKALVQIANSFGSFIALWVAQFFLLDYSIWFVVAIALLNGFLLGRIFIIQHDCGHTSFVKPRKMNALIGTICSSFTIIPYHYWARSHNFHHAHNGQLEYSDVGDIECLTTAEYSALPWYRKLSYRIYRNPLYLFTVGGFVYVAIYNRFALLRDGYFKGFYRNVRWSNIFFVLLYISLTYLLGWKFLWVQGINLAFFGSYALWFFYIQHQYEYIYKSTKEQWDYVLSAIWGSTYYDLPAIGHWLTGNIGYHHIHHLCPIIPNYHLKACHYENQMFVKHARYLSFFESLKTINANLWDEKLQKMVSFSEYSRNKYRAKLPS
jgi:omega-6 fatty acid desaturase (delta-12 desaturase)